MNISMCLIFHIFIVFPKTPQKRRPFPPPPPSYRKSSSRLDRKLPRILPYVTNYSKLCLNYMFFTSIVSHFVCASEVLRTNFASLEARQAPNKSFNWWKSATRGNVSTKTSLWTPGCSFKLIVWKIKFLQSHFQSATGDSSCLPWSSPSWFTSTSSDEVL